MHVQGRLHSRWLNPDLKAATALAQSQNLRWARARASLLNSGAGTLGAARVRVEAFLDSVDGGAGSGGVIGAANGPDDDSDEHGRLSGDGGGQQSSPGNGVPASKHARRQKRLM